MNIFNCHKPICEYLFETPPIHNTTPKYKHHFSRLSHKMHSISSQKRQDKYSSLKNMLVKYIILIPVNAVCLSLNIPTGRMFSTYRSKHIS